MTATIVPATTLPLTTLITTVGQADEGWYLAYGSVFNTLQTDIEKLDRAVASTSQDCSRGGSLLAGALCRRGLRHLAATVPDAGAESGWAAALADLGEGATDSILGTAAATGSAAFVAAPSIRGRHWSRPGRRNSTRR